MVPAMPEVSLKPAKTRSLDRHHPWIFSGALSRMPPLEPGTIVDVLSSEGQFRARGFYNPKSQLAVRVLTWNQAEPIDTAFFRERIRRAWSQRQDLWDPSRTTALRVVMSDADGLPGLVADRYGDHLVVQFLTAGMERQRSIACDALTELFQPQSIYERSDDASRELEGLQKQSGLIYGKAPPDQGVLIQENGLLFQVSIREGHKTGHYCDQRNARAHVGALARGKQVLDAFCNTGGFTLSALKGGATHVTSIDSSKTALAQLQHNLDLNGLLGLENQESVPGDVFEVLRTLNRERRSYDMVVLDPPKFAHSARDVMKAARGYKDINLLAGRLLRPGGFLATFSCSGHISLDLLQKIVFGALNEAGRDGRILSYFCQAEDHPIRLTLPESLYLKGLLIQLD